MIMTERKAGNIKLKDYCLKVTDGTHDSPKQSLEGFSLITSKHLINGKVDISSAYKISKEDYDKANSRSKVDKWDVLLSMIGTVGETALVDYTPNYAIKNIGVFKCGIETKAKYLYYYLSSKKGQIQLKGLLSGTTQQYITLDDLRNLEISLPPLSEQKRIANILSSFDNKIEQLKKENNILEDIAQNIFKEWFVKYNFPNKDGKPYKDNNGKMIDSELGEIPEGWKVGKLGEFGKIICGKTPSKNVSEYFNGKYPFVKIPDMKDIFITRSEDSLTDLGAKQLSGRLLSAGSLCVSCIATIGKVSITTQDSFTNQQINTIIPKEGTLEYLYFTLNDMKEYLEQIGNRGSTTFNINTEMFRNLEIIIPDELLITSFSTATTSLFRKILVNTKTIKNLTKGKNKILQKLIK